jgi:hypothetical protein
VSRRGFVKDSPAFKSWYRGFNTFFDEEDRRIKNLYNRLQLGIKPWEWDIDNYGRDPEMVGYFYPEDILNIEQIDEYEKKAKK